MLINGLVYSIHLQYFCYYVSYRNALHKYLYYGKVILNLMFLLVICVPIGVSIGEYYDARQNRTSVQNTSTESDQINQVLSTLLCDYMYLLAITWIGGCLLVMFKYQASLIFDYLITLVLIMSFLFFAITSFELLWMKLFLLIAARYNICKKYHYFLCCGLRYIVTCRQIIIFGKLIS